jgi:hypothetical protein
MYGSNFSLADVPDQYGLAHKWGSISCAIPNVGLEVKALQDK